MPAVWVSVSVRTTVVVTRSVARVSAKRVGVGLNVISRARTVSMAETVLKSVIVVSVVSSLS